MEMIMSATFATPAAIRGGIRLRHGLIAAVKSCWAAYLVRRIERAAVVQLHAMSDRELRDIGLARSQIELAVRGELDHRRCARHF